MTSLLDSALQKDGDSKPSLPVGPIRHQLGPRSPRGVLVLGRRRSNLHRPCCRDCHDQVMSKRPLRGGSWWVHAEGDSLRVGNNSTTDFAGSGAIGRVRRRAQAPPAMYDLILPRRVRKRATAFRRQALPSPDTRGGYRSAAGHGRRAAPFPPPRGSPPGQRGTRGRSPRREAAQ